MTLTKAQCLLTALTAVVISSFLLTSATHAQVDSCPGAPVPNLEVGMLGQVTVTNGSSVRVREQPSVSAPIVTTMAEAEAFSVIDGPRCADGYRWWQLSWLSNGSVTGWSAEGSGNDYFIEPFVPMTGFQERIRFLPAPLREDADARILYVTSDDNQILLANIRDLSRSQFLYEMSSTPMNCPVWGNDSRSIGVSESLGMRGMRLLVIDSTTGNITYQQTVTEPVAHDKFVWSPDLRYVAYPESTGEDFFDGELSRSYGVHILDMHTGEEQYLLPSSEPLYFGDTDESLYRAFVPRSWSPDSERLIFWGATRMEGTSTFGYVSMDQTVFHEHVRFQYVLGIAYDTLDDGDVYYSWYGRIYSADSLSLENSQWLVGGSTFPVNLIDVSPVGTAMVMSVDPILRGISPADLWYVSMSDLSLPRRIGHNSARFGGWLSENEVLVVYDNGLIYLIDMVNNTEAQLELTDVTCVSLVPAGL